MIKWVRGPALPTGGSEFLVAGSCAWEGRVCGLRQGLVVQASPQDFQLCRKFFPLWQH